MSVSSQHISPVAMQPIQDGKSLSPQEEPKAGASWIAEEQHVIPYNRLGIVIPGLMACLAVVALDQASIPTIRGYLIPDE